MLTKNCKSILDGILSLNQNDWYKAYSVRDLVQITSLSVDEIISALESLEQTDMVQIQYLTIRSYRPTIDWIRLTERGIYYKDFEKEKRINYLKDKWIDFLALVVASTALIISIAAFLKPLPG